MDIYKTNLFPYVTGDSLDGNHRLKIDPDAPRRVVTGLTENEKRAFVYRANRTRRNLSPEQKRAQLGELKKIAKALNGEGKKQGEIAALIGIGQSTISEWLNGKAKNKNVSIIGSDNTNIFNKKASPYDGRRQV